MIAATSQIILTAASAVMLILVIQFIGAVVLAIVRLALPALQPSIGLAFGAGLLALFLTGWNLFLLATPLRVAFTGLLAATVAAAVLGAAIPAGRRRISGLLREWRSAWPEALLLVVLCTMMSALLLLPLGGDDLALVTIGNNDIHHYIRLAAYLLDESAGSGNLFQYDLRATAVFEVFGAHTLLAFAAFLRHTSPVFVAEVPLVAVTALIGTAVACICRDVWRLPGALSAILGAALVTSGLFAFTALQYFLSQLTCAALMLIAVHYLLAASGRRRLDLAAIVAGQTVLLGCVLFDYPVLLFPLIAGGALLAWWLTFVQAADERPTLLSLAAVRSSLGLAVGGGLLAVALVCLAAPTRVAHTIGRLAFFAQANIAGWPMGFVRPAAILGLPTFSEPAFGNSAGIARQVAEVGIVLVLVVWLMLLVNRPGPTRAERLLRLTPLLAFFGLFLGYVAVWRLYGTSYQQWKSAVSFPLMFSFSVPASLCYLAYRTQRRALGVVALSLAAALVLSANWGSIVRAFYPRAMHFPRGAAAIAAIDDMPEITRVYVDFGNASIGERMLAANFVKRPTVAFLQPTYYHQVQASVHPTPAEPLLRPMVPGCVVPDGIRLGQGYVLATSDRRAALVPGASVAFDRPLGTCINATGLSDPEVSGTWTSAPSVELAFACDCGSRDNTVTLVARAFVGRGVPQQRMVARLNGVPVGDWTVSDAAEHRFVVPLPGGVDDVRLDLSIPDATSPASVGLSDDSRLLGFRLISLTLAD